MPTRKNVRDLDRIVIRAPDGMRDRLQARAAAENMSVNAYVVEVLDRVLAASEGEWRATAVKELKRINNEIEIRQEQIEQFEHRRSELFRQWEEIAGETAFTDSLDEK